jgi:hypothetical protein
LSVEGDGARQLVGERLPVLIEKSGEHRDLVGAQGFPRHDVDRIFEGGDFIVRLRRHAAERAGHDIFRVIGRQAFADALGLIDLDEAESASRTAVTDNKARLPRGARSPRGTRGGPSSTNPPANHHELTNTS